MIRFSRRELLTLGTLTPLGLTLPTLLANPPAPGRRRRPERCLIFYLEGGPSHIDLWDMKPEAPAEVRGEFRPIRTRNPGLIVCEHLPRTAELLHRFALVRSVTHDINDHNAGTYFALTGKYPKEGPRLVTRSGPNDFPAIGSVLAKFRPTGRALPDFVHIPELMFNNNAELPGQFAGILGPAYEPIVTGDPSLPGWHLPGLAPRVDLPAPRLTDRTRLLHDVDTGLGRLADDVAVQRMDLLHRRAFAMLTSPEVRRAFDLDQEPAHVRRRYGVDPGSDRSLEARLFGGLPQLGQSTLLARRLLEAGVRLVTLCTGRRIDQTWDTHREHFPLLRQSILPQFDQAFSALIEDLALRGMLEDTLVVAMGEFGRTPKLGYITSGAGAAPNGRDHWPFCYTVLFAGAGVPEGAIIGASDRIAAYPSLDPVTPHDIAATIYEIMGIGQDAEIHDQQQRPTSLIQGSGRPIPALVG